MPMDGMSHRTCREKASMNPLVAKNAAKSNARFVASRQKRVGVFSRS